MRTTRPGSCSRTCPGLRGEKRTVHGCAEAAKSRESAGAAQARSLDLVPAVKFVRSMKSAQSLEARWAARRYPS